ncbi:MAG: hypothetical protein QW379_04010 [Thermoplasmata archaeon]
MHRRWRERMVKSRAKSTWIVIPSCAGLFLWKKKKAEPSPPSTPTQPSPPPGGGAGVPPSLTPVAPPQPAPLSGSMGTESYPKAKPAPPEKLREWAEFERIYGQPHPEAGGWVNPPPAGWVSGGRPRCPVDGFSVSYEVFSGQYFCSRCNKRYTKEEVAPKGPSREYEYFAVSASRVRSEEEAGEASSRPAGESAPQPLWLSAGATLESGGEEASPAETGPSPETAGAPEPSPREEMESPEGTPAAQPEPVTEAEPVPPSAEPLPEAEPAELEPGAGTTEAAPRGETPEKPRKPEGG